MIDMRRMMIRGRHDSLRERAVIVSFVGKRILCLHRLGDARNNLLYHIRVLEFILNTEVVCLSKFLLCIAKLGFKSDPRFLHSGKSVPFSDDRIENTRFCDDVLRKIQKLHFRVGRMASISQNLEVLDERIDGIDGQDRVECEVLNFFLLLRNFLRSHLAIGVEEM